MTKNLLLFVLITIVDFALIWFFASLFTSGLKFFNHACGKNYVIETLVSGNWFCSKT